jgi:hypothetical protein
MKHQTFSNGWLADGNFEKELDNHLVNAKKHLVKGDSLNCAKEVERFQDKVNAEYRTTLRSDQQGKPRGRRFVTEDGWKSLYFNAQYLIERLITLPAKPIGVPLLQQLDSLKAEVQRQQDKKNLGGLLLVKGLTLFVDQAKRQLQQRDSTKAAITIKLFQVIVDETNELTDALLEKGRPLPPLYAKDEAYVQLHYRVKYILEGLPELRIDIGQQRTRLMDKELQKELDALKEKVEEEQ